MQHLQAYNPYNLYCQYLYKLYWQMVCMQYLQTAVDAVPLCENKKNLNQSHKATTTTERKNNDNTQGHLERITNAKNESQQYYKINTTDNHCNLPKFGNRSESQYFLEQLDYPLRRMVVPFNAVENSIDQKRLVRSRYTKLGKVAYITQDTKAANLVTDYTFDKDRGFMTDIINNSLSKNIWYNYSYDQLGNLKKRADIKDASNNIGLSECFYYDDLNRMTATRRYANFGVNCGTQPTGTTEITSISYNGKGNITQKDGQNYSYLNASSNSIGNSPHQVTQKGSQVFTYDANGNNTEMTNFQSKNGTFQTRHIDYNTFNKVENIWTGNDPNNPIAQASYKYDTTRQKYARIDSEGTTEKVTYFIGNVEVEYNGGTVKYKCQLGNYAIITESANTTQEAYLYTDHLGSVDTITDKNGNILQKITHVDRQRQQQSHCRSTLQIRYHAPEVCQN